LHYSDVEATAVFFCDWQAYVDAFGIDVCPEGFEQLLTVFYFDVGRAFAIAGSPECLEGIAGLQVAAGNFKKNGTFIENLSLL